MVHWKNMITILLYLLYLLLTCKLYCIVPQSLSLAETKHNHSLIENTRYVEWYKMKNSLISGTYRRSEMEMNNRRVATNQATCYTKVTRKIQYWFKKYPKSVGEQVGTGNLIQCFYLVWNKAFKDSSLECDIPLSQSVTFPNS